MSGSVAALSFSIDTSQVNQGSQNLDQLAASAGKVRASTRFLVTEFGSANEALTQLATSGRASLAAFEQISQNLDLVTGRLHAMRTAVSDTVGMIGHQGLSNALTTFQQQFDAMATVFGTSAAQLEKFNQQAQVLGMNSYQITSSLQRITAAQQNITPAGEAIRQQLNMEGINMGGDPTQILKQVIGYASTHQQSQQAMQDLMSIIGPTDPATYARLMHEPYFTVQQRLDLANQGTLGVETSRLGQQVAQGQFKLHQESRSLEDSSQYFALGWTDLGLGVNKERTRFLREMQKSIAEDRRDHNAQKLQEDQASYDELKLAHGGSEQALAAEGQWATTHWNSPDMPVWRTPKGIWQSWLEPNKDGSASWLSRVLDKPLFLENAQVIRQQFKEDESRINPWDIGGQIAAGWHNVVAATENAIGIYHAKTDSQHQIDQLQAAINNDERRLAAPHGFGVNFGSSPSERAREAARLRADITERQDKINILKKDETKPVGADEQYFIDSNGAEVAQSLGYGGFMEVHAARANLSNLADQGTNSYGDKLRRLFGNSEGSAILAQQKNSQAFITDHAATPGFDQMQSLSAQGFLDSQVTGVGRAQVLSAFTHGLGLDPGRWQEEGLSVKDILDGKGAPGAVLTPGERQAFGRIWGQYLTNESSTLDTGFQQQEMLMKGTPGQQGELSLANSDIGAGEYAARIAQLQAYHQELIKTGDATLAATAGQHAYTEAIQQNAAAAARAVKDLKQQNDRTDKMVAAGMEGLRGDHVGSYAAAEAEARIQNQLDLWRKNNPGGNVNAYEAQLRRQQQDGLVMGVQSAYAQEINQRGDQQAAIESFGEPVAQRNRDMLKAQFAPQLEMATGSYKTQIEGLIDSFSSLKTNVDLAAQAMTGLQVGISEEQRATAYRQASKLPVWERQRYIEARLNQDRVDSMTQPLAGIDAHGMKVIAPAYHNTQVLAADLPSSGHTLPRGIMPPSGHELPQGIMPPSGQKVSASLASEISSPGSMGDFLSAFGALLEIMGKSASGVPMPQDSSTTAKQPVGNDVSLALTPNGNLGASGVTSAVIGKQADRAAPESIPPHSGIPRNNPLNLTYDHQPGAVGYDPNNNVAIFSTLRAGEKADMKQLGIDIGRGYNSIDKLVPHWAVTASPDRQKTYEGGVLSYVQHHGFSKFDGTQRLDVTNKPLMRAIFAGMSQQEGRLVPYNSTLDTASAQDQNQSTATQAETLYQRQQTALRMRLLATGSTGAAELAAASVPDPTLAPPVATAQIAQRRAQIFNQFNLAQAGLSANATIKKQSDQALIAAAPGGPDQTMQAQATLQAEGQARTDTPYTPSSPQYQSWIHRHAETNYNVMKADAAAGVSQQAQKESIDNTLKIAEYNHQFIVSPYARILADASSQVKSQLAAANVDQNSAAGQFYTKQAMDAARLQVMQAKLDPYQQSAAQIGGDVSGFLQNATFSYQHGPGAGLYFRHLVGGLLDQTGRSIFNAAIGTPVDNFIKGNVTDAFSSLLGLKAPANSKGTATSNGGQPASRGGGSSVATQALGGLGGMLQNSAMGHVLDGAGGMFAHLFGGLGGNSVTPGIASAISSGSASALPATPAAAGIFPKLGGWLASLFSAQGNVFGAGRQVPFAAGGVFDGPTTMPMALLGEAGPEAIMPLRRGPDGKLGVVAAHTSGSGASGAGYTIQVNAPITVGANATGSSGQMAPHQQAALQRQFHAVLTQGIKKVMAEQSRPGGMIQPQH